MPDWKRITVGEAFDLTSRDPNYYRDLFLLWPFLLFSIAALLGLWSGHSVPERMYTYRMAAFAVVALLLAKEKAFLLLGSLSYVALRLGIGMIFIHDWRLFVEFVVTAGTLILLIKRLNARKWKPSYSFLPGSRVLDLAVGIAGLLFGVCIVILLRPR
jgi:hypothetical protein